MMEQELIAAKYDSIFKRLFGDRKHINIVADFLKTVLDLKDDEYEALTISDSNLQPLRKDGKIYILDLKLTTAGGKIINIEIQLCNYRHLRDRIVAYGARLLSEQLDSGQSYQLLNKVITVLIVDFDMIHESKEYHHNFLMSNIYTNLVFTDIFKIYVLELTKISHVDDGNTFWPWLKLLRTSKREELDMLQQRYPNLQEPIHIVKELNADERVREEHWAIVKAQYDEAMRRQEEFEAMRSVVFAEGKAEGEYEGRAAVALAMLHGGLPISDVTKFSGLTREEVEDLQKQAL
jgi:predicted transposase/invertase (TIGR01784 family)